MKRLPKGFTLLMTFFLFAPLLSIHAQIANEMDEALELERMTYAQAARFVLAASETLPADTSADQAFAYAQEQKWISGDAQAGGAITLGALSLLIMKSFDIKGGFMYALFPSGRYAYRSLVRRGFIQGFADPALTVSGDRFFLILGKALSYKGDV